MHTYGLDLTYLDRFFFPDSSQRLVRLGLTRIMIKNLSGLKLNLVWVYDSFDSVLTWSKT